MSQGAFPEEDLQQPLSPWRHFFTNGLTGLA
ncbi:MAG: phosphate ABC transporter, permease protein PstA, partial [Microcystis sp.]